jgi:hypothetical protein
MTFVESEMTHANQSSCRGQTADEVAPDESFTLLNYVHRSILSRHACVMRYSSD